MNALLDTCALTHVLNDPARLERFESLVKREGWRLVVPSAALDELFVPDNAELLSTTIESLLRLDTSLGSQLAFAQPQVVIWNRELAGEVGALPVLSVSDRSGLLRMLRNALQSEGLDPVSRFRDVRATVRAWRAARRETGGVVRTRAREGNLFATLRPEDVKTELELARPAQLSWLVDRLAGAEDTDLDLTDGRRCPAVKTWVGLTFMSMWAETLPSRFGAGDPYFEMLEPDRNDFFDAALTSPAGYCDRFITRDRRLLLRCRHLNRVSWVPFATDHLVEDLGI